MALLLDPQAWLSFLTLAGLEIVLGIDNILLLSVLVDRLPQRRRASARFLGSGFAMLTRIALLLSVVIALVTAWAAIACSYQSNWPVGFFVAMLSAAWYGAGRAYATARRKGVFGTATPLVEAPSTAG